MFFLKRKERKNKKGRDKEKKGENRSIKLNINQKAIPVQQSQNKRNHPGYRFYQLIVSNNQSIKAEYD